MKYCDLHTHSEHSDGTCTATRVVELAKEAGLAAVALCDHNTVSGLPEFLEAGARLGVQTVPGIEFSTDYKGAELHILALFVKPEHYEVVTVRASSYRIQKEQSDVQLCKKLTGAGYPLDYEKIKAQTADGFVNRAVIGAEMVRLGYVESVKEAFKSFLDASWGYYQPPQRPDAVEIIRFIKSIGAVAVFAHPFLSLDEQTLEEFLPQAKLAGLDGMEVLYSKYDEETRQRSVRLVQKHGLLPSGGSDFHGGNKPDIAVGVGRGDLLVPYSWLEDLKNNI